MGTAAIAVLFDLASVFDDRRVLYALVVSMVLIVGFAVGHRLVWQKNALLQAANDRSRNLER